MEKTKRNKILMYRRTTKDIKNNDIYVCSSVFDRILSFFDVRQLLLLELVNKNWRNGVKTSPIWILKLEYIPKMNKFDISANTQHNPGYNLNLEVNKDTVLVTVDIDEDKKRDISNNKTEIVSTNSTESSPTKSPNKKKSKTLLNVHVTNSPENIQEYSVCEIIIKNNQKYKQVLYDIEMLEKNMKLTMIQKGL
eukprot:UN25191